MDEKSNFLRGLVTIRQIALLLLAAISAIAVCVFFYFREERHVEEVLREPEAHRVSTLTRQFQRDWNLLVSHTGSLAEDESLIRYLATGETELLQRFERHLRVVSRLHPEFDELSLLDENGLERALVTQAGGIAPASEFESHAEDAYFRPTLALPRGQVHVSRFEPEPREGALDQAERPELRFSVPVYDAAGRVRGMLVIVSLGDHLLRALEQSVPELRHRVRVLNYQGHWILGPTPESEWGGLFPERAARSLVNLDPALWAKVAANNVGQERFAGGLFSWEHFSTHIAAGTTQSFSDVPFLVIGSQVSAQEWNASLQHIRSTFVVLGIALTGLTLLGGWLYLRHRGERERRHEADRINTAILQGAGTAVITSTPDGTVRSINSTAERLLGWTAEEVVGRQQATIFYDREETDALAGMLAKKTPQPFENLEGPATKVMAPDKPFEGEWTCVRKDGSRFPAWITNTAIHDGHGRIIRFLAMLVDITERKAVEEALRAARNAAEESAKLKARFLANMSHEIRTPMNGVVGMIGLLLDTELTQEQRMFADTARSSADGLLTIINDILDFSKIEAGQLMFNNIPFDPRTPVEDCLSLLAEKAHAKGLELAYLFEENAPSQLVGDPGRLQQVLINLVGNAVKFTAQGEVVVEVKKVGGSDGRARVRFAVRDTGIGIPADAQARLFQPFVQADATTTTRFGGTGLGLAICRQLVALMAGEIGLESEPGKGSTFWFTVELPQPPTTAKVVPRQVDLAGMRALVVDDNATNREILLRQLAGWQIRAVAVVGGAEALVALRSAAAEMTPFDFCLTDMQMPEMNGMQLAAQVRADPALAATQVLLLSSIAETVPKNQLRGLGLAASLIKPVRPALLQQTLEDLAHQHESPKPRAVAGQSASPFVTADVKLRIVLAEDNPVNQQIARLQLAKFGYQPVIASDGAQALAAVRATPHDLVLMDCQMPVMDGFAAARAIRSWEAERRERGEQFTAIYIIAMTANAMAGDREACLASGMDDYISKPVRMPDLAAAIARAPAAHGDVRSEAPVGSGI